MKIHIFTRLTTYLLIITSVIFLKFYSQNNFNYIYEVNFVENMSDIEKYIYYDVFKYNQYNFQYQNDISIQKSIDLGIFKLNSNSFYCYLSEDICKTNLISIYKNSLSYLKEDFKNKLKKKIENDDKNYKKKIILSQRFCNFLKSANADKKLIILNCKRISQQNKIDELIKNNFDNLINDANQLWILNLSKISKKPFEIIQFFKEIIVIILLLAFSFSFIELLIKKNET